MQIEKKKEFINRKTCTSSKNIYKLNIYTTNHKHGKLSVNFLLYGLSKLNFFIHENLSFFYCSLPLIAHRENFTIN